MRLLMIRHAQAVDFAASDSERGLTEKGFAQAQAVGEYMVDQNLLPDLVLTSPYLRAEQTAETLCQAADLDSPVVAPWLACGMSPYTALQELAAYGEIQSVAICGHNPDFSMLAEYLLGAESGSIHFRKASIMHFSQIMPPRQQGYLEAFIPPPMIRKTSSPD